MQRDHEVMNTIKEFTAEDATVIVGTVIDEAMEDGCASPWSRPASAAQSCATRRPPKLEIAQTVVERTGTDNVGMRVTETIDYEELDQPGRRRAAVVRRRASPAPAFDASISRRSCASRRTDGACGEARLYARRPAGARGPRNASARR